jgi:hypothetical protein
VTFECKESINYETFPPSVVSYVSVSKKRITNAIMRESVRDESEKERETRDNISIGEISSECVVISIS